MTLGVNSRVLLYDGDIKTMKEAAARGRTKSPVRAWNVGPVVDYIVGLGEDLGALSDTTVSDVTRFVILLTTGCRCMDAAKMVWAHPIQREPKSASLTEALRIDLYAAQIKETLLSKTRPFWSGAMTATRRRSPSEREARLWLGCWLDEYIRRATLSASQRKPKQKLVPAKVHGRMLLRHYLLQPRDRAGRIALAGT